ncbi:phage tail tape measure protein [Leptotrichia trevisanii]|uniref:phage tail tape measure protein n=1 Tax=Leptotrichia trevisanii TaxID=109328 RepID=UPI0026EFAF28|nr:phage tail tape measure protein [Leptotrichia trevisanii]
MASGVGVTYELEFVIKDKNAKRWIESVRKEAERLAKALDKVTLNNFNKQIQHMQKHLQSQGNQLKSQLKMAQEMMKSLGTGKNIKSGLDNVKKDTQAAKKKMDELNKAKEAVGKSVKDPLKNVAKGADNAMKRVKGLLNKVRDGALYKAGSFITQAGMEALQEYGQTDYELRGASAKTGGYGTDLKEYRKLAKQVGGATKFNNLDVAQAINAGATLGIKKDEMKEIIPAASNLAQAFNSDITPALEMVKMHMNSYQLSAKEAQKVTDMIAVTSKNTAADLPRLAEGFKYVGASGKALGVPMETVYAMLGKMNDNGLLGSTAGTGLNQMFESMKDFKKRGKLEGLIGKVTDEKGNLQDMTSILERLKGVTDKMGNADKAGVLKSIFGVQGGRAVNTLLNGSIEDLKKLQNEIKNSSGAAEKLSKFMMQGSAGAVETLMGTMSSTFAAVFDSLEPLLVPVAGLFMGIAEAIGMVAEKAPWLLQLVSVLGALVVGELVFQKLKASVGPFITGIKEAIAKVSLFKLVLYGLLAVGLVVIFNLFKQWQDYLQENADVSKVWESALQSLGTALGAIGDLIMAVIGAIFGFSTKSSDAKDKTKIWGMTADEVKQKLESFKEKVDKFTEKIQQMSEWVDKNKEKVKMWGFAFLGLVAGITILWALTAAQSAFNAVAAMNPYVLIVMLIIGAIMLIGFWLMDLYNKNEEFRQGVDSAWQMICEAVSQAATWISQKLGELGQWLKKLWDDNENIRMVVEMVWNFIKDHIELVIGFIIGGPFGLFIAGLIKLYTENETARAIIDGIWAAIVAVVGGAIENIIGFINNAIGAVSHLVGAFNDLLHLNWSGVGSHLQGFGGNVMGMGKNVMNLSPMSLADRGIKAYQNGYNNSLNKSHFKHNKNLPKTSNVNSFFHKAVGTDNFQAQGGGGMTAVDEHGDEAIWLPNGSMVARNTTTLDMLNNLKSIKKNTRGGTKETGTVVTNNNKFVFNVTGTDETLQELKRELEKLGIV